MENKKTNHLTLYIVLALVLGVCVGVILNTRYVQHENLVIASLERQLQDTRLQMHGIADTTGAAYKILHKHIADLNCLKDNASADRDKKLEPFSLIADLFLRLIKMIIAPIVFTTLAVGVAKIGDSKAIGRIGARTLIWFSCGSFLSLLLGMGLVNFFQPGSTMHLPVPDIASSAPLPAVSMNARDFLYHMFPTSIFDAMARNEILQVVVFALFFGFATASIGKRGIAVTRALDAISHVILKMTMIIMRFAPVAVFGAITVVIAKQGIGILQTYSLFIGEFYLGLFLLLGILLLACYFIIGRRVRSLLSHIKQPTLLAFSTNSSEAAFPSLILQLERFGCHERIVSFVLPLGYSFNLAGSMMYMAFASLFLAQCYGMHLDMGTQFSMLMVLLLTSKGIAGVPRASLVIVAGTLATFKIPEAGLALLLGIDPIMDMGRTAANVVGNSIATVVVNKWEKP
ncbi:MAG: dicarboxylate/amino acid:cation symporter [Flavipsychrobacter sp.]|nr:dicarboxylate/amino acid:cation symporter [Flavipsychrobacter sp.]